MMQPLPTTSGGETLRNRREGQRNRGETWRNRAETAGRNRAETGHNPAETSRNRGTPAVSTRSCFAALCKLLVLRPICSGIKFIIFESHLNYFWLDTVLNLSSSP